MGTAARQRIRCVEQLTGPMAGGWVRRLSVWSMPAAVGQEPQGSRALSYFHTGHESPCLNATPGAPWPPAERPWKHQLYRRLNTNPSQTIPTIGKMQKFGRANNTLEVRRSRPVAIYSCSSPLRLSLRGTAQTKGEQKTVELQTPDVSTLVPGRATELSDAHQRGLLPGEAPQSREHTQPQGISRDTGTCESGFTTVILTSRLPPLAFPRWRR